MIILTDTANIQNNNGHELTIPVKKCIIYIITIMEKVILTDTANI